MFTPRITCRAGVNAQPPDACSADYGSSITRPRSRRRNGFTLPTQRERASALCRAVVPRLRDEGGFTLIELMIVVGIIAVLLVLMAPAFTTIKGGTDVTS